MLLIRILVVHHHWNMRLIMNIQLIGFIL